MSVEINIDSENITKKTKSSILNVLLDLHKRKGFKAEDLFSHTDQLVNNARKELKEKGIDLDHAALKIAEGVDEVDYMGDEHRVEALTLLTAIGYELRNEKRTPKGKAINDVENNLGFIRGCFEDMKIIKSNANNIKVDKKNREIIDYGARLDKMKLSASV